MSLNTKKEFMSFKRLTYCFAIVCVGVVGSFVVGNLIGSKSTIAEAQPVIRVAPTLLHIIEEPVEVATIIVDEKIEESQPEMQLATRRSMDQMREETNNEIKCLADNIYWEARNQSRLGMIAVGRVVVNRVRSRNYPSTVCGVILQGPTRESWKTRQHADLDDNERIFHPVRNRCQFSWYCDGRSDTVRQNENDIFTMAWHVASAIILDNRWDGFINGATHYHADYVSPKWSSSLTRISQIDNHIFYRH
jgi:spore germination cell wall hydrolase CwlJ-like protein